MRKLNLAFAALACGCAANALAQSLPNPSISAVNSGFQVNSPGVYSTPNTTVDLALAPAVEDYTSAASSQGSYQPEGNISYFFEATGAPDVMVPVSITYTLESFAVGYDGLGVATIGTSLYNSDGTPEPGTSVYSVVCSTTGLNPCTNETNWTGLSNIVGGSFYGYVPSNTATPISLLSVAFADGDFNYGSSAAWALADPQITVLDPNFTLQVPDGVGNETGFGGIAGALPEPSTWALMLLGFGTIGAAMRRRNRQQLQTRTA